MNYYLRYNNQTLGPLAEQQIANLLQQGRFDDSVRFSTDLSRWYSASEISTFRTIQLPSGGGRPAAETSNARRFVAPPKQNAKRNTDHSLLYFFGFCLVAVLGFVAIIYSINQDDQDASASGDSSITAENLSGSSLPSIYQKKQRAVGLVTLTFQDQKGNFETIPIGTAFAIKKNRFVTNAHVAYAVKNGFEEGLVTPLLIRYFAGEAKKKRQSLKEYLQDIGDRGIEQARSRLLEGLKEHGVKIRDVEIRLNHSNGKSFRVAKVQVHPRYNPAAQKQTGEFDVAVFEISGSTDCYFDVASKSELHSLQAGIPVASAGFPTEGLDDLNIEKPEASYATGDIKKITDFDNKDAGGEYNRSIFHSIPAAGGVSGSPIFVANGKVIAVLWGGSNHGFDAQGARVSSAALQNFAVRIDQIYDVGDPVTWDKWVNDPTKNVSLKRRVEEPAVTASARPVASRPASSSSSSRVQNSEYANAKAEYDRIVSELNKRNQKLAEVLNAYDAVKLLAQMAVLSGNVSPADVFKLNKQMKELELAIEQEKAALARLNARKEELRIRYNF